MRRADRLFQIIQCLRGGQLMTAAQMAERLEVSERTIYRDIVDLQSNGVPIDGERGMGYMLRDGFDLPPLMFSRSEIASLVAGARFVKAWGGMAMAAAAEDALSKIEAVIPPAERSHLNHVEIQAPRNGMSRRHRRLVDEVSSALERQVVLEIDYGDADGASTSRRIRPLSLWYWGKVWTIVAWCELRKDFRLFRLDRISSMSSTDCVYVSEAGQSLQDFLIQSDSIGRPMDLLRMD